MHVQYATLETCAEATGTVVVIDVIRAFTTAAFAFAAGAHEIIAVGTVEEALALRARGAGDLVMGHDVGGLPPPGFDFGNSPRSLIGVNLQGKHLIQRTGAGTQGLVRASPWIGSILLSYYPSPAAGRAGSYEKGQTRCGTGEMNLCASLRPIRHYTR